MKIALYAPRLQAGPASRTRRTNSPSCANSPEPKAGLSYKYVDRASSKRGDREQFQKMFVDAAQRWFDLVLFWALDRFSREGVLETLNHYLQAAVGSWRGNTR